MIDALFLSPHSDDIAWSAGHLACMVAGRVKEARLVTVFSISNYTPMLGLLDMDRATEIRADEDREFCARTGLRYSALGLLEGMVRGYPDLESLFIAETGKADPIYPLALERASESLAGEKDKLVFAPLGLGRHIEHLVCNNIAVDLCGSNSLIFYEDLPYAASMPEALIREKIETRVGRHLKPMSIPVDDLSRKKMLAKIYRSQYRESVWSSILDYSLRVGSGVPAERVWGSSKALARLRKTLRNSS